MVQSCGVDDAHVEYSGYLQEDVVRLPADAELADDQLTCLARTAFETGYFFEIPEEYYATYYARSQAIAEPWDVELAREHLAELGKLDALPTRELGESDADFALKLELLCGSEGALSSDYGPHSIDPEWALANMRSDPQLSGTELLCLSSAGTVAGFRIFMIGNGKASDSGG